MFRIYMEWDAYQHSNTMLPLQRTRIYLGNKNANNKGKLSQNCSLVGMHSRKIQASNLAVNYNTLRTTHEQNSGKRNSNEVSRQRK